MLTPFVNMLKLRGMTRVRILAQTTFVAHESDSHGIEHRVAVRMFQVHHHGVVASRVHWRSYTDERGVLDKK